MNKEFVPYEEALALKELGFEPSPCFRYWNCSYISGDDGKELSMFKNEQLYSCAAPLFQQTFRWCRKEHKLRSFVDIRVYDVDSPNQWIYDYQIKMGNGINTQPYYSGDFDSYEEAELACLRKLIEIIKNG